MKALVKRIGGRLLVAHIGAVMRAGRREIPTAVSELATGLLTSGPFEARAPEFMSAVHRVFVERGDMADKVPPRVLHDCDWHKASCELLILEFDSQRLNYCQLGTVHLFTADDSGWRLIAPVHNVAQEVALGTIEASCLRPYSTRSQEEIAQQLCEGEPKVVPRLAALPSESFLAELSQFPTRLAGFFPAVRGERIVYSELEPVPAVGAFDCSAAQRIIVYAPSAHDVFPNEYKLGSIEGACRRRLSAPAERLRPDEERLTEAPVCVEIPAWSSDRLEVLLH